MLSCTEGSNPSPSANFRKVLMTHKQVLVVRKDLNMRKGKIAAQAAHGSLAVILNLMKTKLGLKDPRAVPWLEGAFKKVCVSVDSEQELIDIFNKAQAKGVLSVLITDAGHTEFHGVPTKTVVAVGPDREDVVDAITGGLKLL